MQGGGFLAAEVLFAPPALPSDRPGPPGPELDAAAGDSPADLEPAPLHDEEDVAAVIVQDAPAGSCTCHVVYSAMYAVPVLLFAARDPGTRPSRTNAGVIIGALACSRGVAGEGEMRLLCTILLCRHDSRRRSRMQRRLAPGRSRMLDMRPAPLWAARAAPCVRQAHGQHSGNQLDGA